MQDIKRAGGDAHAFQADISKRDQVHGLVDAVISKWGQLNVFVNNAATFFEDEAMLEDEREDQIDQLFAVNYKGTLWGIQAAAKVLPSGGSIINISSIAARNPSPVRSVHLISSRERQELRDALTHQKKKKKKKRGLVCIQVSRRLWMC